MTSTFEFVVEIAKRMENVERYYGTKPMKRLKRVMDLMAAHADCPLDLEGLLNAPSLDFVHDVVGISNNLNRETGRLQNCFLPRLAKRREVTK